MEALRCVEESSLALRWVDGPLPIVIEHGRRTAGKDPASFSRWREALPYLARVDSPGVIWGVSADLGAVG